MLVLAVFTLGLGSPAGAWASSSTPIDIEGNYTLTTSTGCWNSEGGTLTISDWLGSTGGTGVFKVTLTEADSSTYSGTGSESGTLVQINLNGTTYKEFTASPSGSTMTLTQSFPAGGQCEGVNSNAESLSSLPTISGTLTKAGAPFGTGVRLTDTGGRGPTGAAVLSDGSYEFWVQPADTYTVRPVQPPPAQPQFVLFRCTGYHTPPPDGCTIPIYPSEPPDQGTASWVIGGTGIGGKVTDVDGSAMAGVQVNLTGTDSTTGQPVALQTLTGSDGSYSFTLNQGSYSVKPSPDPAGGQFLVIACDGTPSDGACDINLQAGQLATANFRRAALIVNSTGTGTDQTEADQGICDITPGGASQTCTLPQAILTSNHLGGQPIAFNIPEGGGNTFDGSVPQIRDPTGSAVPQIAAPATIDGGSQPGGRVELSGVVKSDSVTYGLVVGAGGAGSTINGMVINGYQEDIDLKGGRDTVTGNRLGTNPSGTTAEPLPLGPNVENLPFLPVAQVGIRVESSGNQLGGPSNGNVIASSYSEYADANPQAPVTTYGLVGSGDVYDTAGGNVIQGNFIGLSPGGGQAPAEGAPLIDRPPVGWKVDGEPVQLGLVASGGDTIGGSAPGDGNLVGGGGGAGPGSVVQGNTFTDGGLDGAGGLDVAAFSASGATVGGATSTPGTGVGNTFYAVDPDAWELTAHDRAVIQGNVFKDDSEGAIVTVGRDVTIGGASANLGNLIEHNGDDGDPLNTAGVRVTGGGARIEHNTFEDNRGGGAVGIVLGGGTTVTDNVMKGNHFGISFYGGFFLDGEAPSDRVNDDQPYPVIRSAENRASGTVVSGVYDEPAPLSFEHSITVDLYAMKCSKGGTDQQGEVFLGTRTLSVLLGESDFTLTFDPVPARPGYHCVTATTTAPDGSTSEFSPSFEIGSHPDPFYRVGVAPTSNTVAMSTSPTGTTAGVAVVARANKRGHGTLLLYCPVTASKYCKGTYTLRTTRRHAQTIAKGRVKIVPGYVHVVELTLAGKLLAQLEHKHRLRVKLTINARDAAKHHNHKTRNSTVTLVYKNR